MSAEPKSAKLLQVALAKLIRHRDMQARDLSDDELEEMSDAYADDMRNGDKFPPLKAVQDGQMFWLWDGFIRARAYEKVGQKFVEVEVTPGTRRDAQRLSLGANPGHGYRRRNKDIAKSVNRALDDAEWSSWSNRKIADLCKVDEGTIRRAKLKRNPPPEVTDFRAAKAAEVPQPRKVDISALPAREQARRLAEVEAAVPDEAVHRRERYHGANKRFEVCPTCQGKGRVPCSK